MSIITVKRIDSIQYRGTCPNSPRPNLYDEVFTKALRLKTGQCVVVPIPPDAKDDHKARLSFISCLTSGIKYRADRRELKRIVSVRQTVDDCVAVCLPAH